MAALLGSTTNIIYKLGTIATPYGTALSGGANDLLLVNSLTHALGADILPTPAIGSGLSMRKGSARGNLTPTVSLDMPGGFRNGMERILAQFFGAASVGPEITVGSGDYKHTLTMNPSPNTVYGTIAFEGTDAAVFEYPSCACTGFTLTAVNPISVVGFTPAFLADKRVITGSVNTNASLNAATQTDSEVAYIDHEDDFWIDTEASVALSAPDQNNITGYTLTLSRPQEHSREIKGTPGAGSPFSTDLITGTLAVTFSKLNDMTWFTANDAGTTFKSKFLLEGQPIGAGGSVRSIAIYLPRMKVVTSPDYNLTGAGNNPVTVTFELYAADAAPTGMTSVYPYMEIVNGSATAMIV